MAVEIQSTMKPKNNGAFHLVEACDVDVNGTRLDKTLDDMSKNAGGVVDVDELPTQNINENVIYRVSKNVFTDVYVKDEDISGTLAEYLAENGITNCPINTQVVTKLPANLWQSVIANNGGLYLYIIESSGIAFCNVGTGIVTLGQCLLQSGSFDHGWSSDVSAETAAGVYCVYEPTRRYYIYKQGVWTELADTAFVENIVAETASNVVDSVPNIVDNILGSFVTGIVDVEELPTENINDNVIYRLVRPLVYRVINGRKMTLEYYLDSNNSLPNLHFYAVSKLPDVLKQSSFIAHEDAYVYVVKGTGIAYCDVGYGTQTIGERFTGEYDSNKGWITNIAEDGFYCGISYTYYVHEMDGWSVLSRTPNDDKIKQILAVSSAIKMDEILSNAMEDDIGKCYIYVGKSTDDYKTGSTYMITYKEVQG